MRTATAALLVTLMPAASADARSREVAIHVTRLGGTTTLAQPFVDRFLRHLESAAGWTPDSMKGRFIPSKSRFLAFVSQAKPGIGIMEPPLYFEYRKAWQLQPILQAESKDLVSDRLHLVVRDPAMRRLADLKGKRLCTALSDYPPYLSRVVFGGKVDAASHFALKRAGQAMQGAREILRGTCDAALLDAGQLAAAAKIEGGKALRSIHESPKLPPLPVVLFGASLSAKERDALVGALTSMCGTPKGGAICRKMHMDRFVPFDPSLYDK